MLRRIPIVPTLLVLVLAAGLASLGVWQLHRLSWKEALLARFYAAEKNPVDVSWPKAGTDDEDVLYRHSRVMCQSVSGMSATAGRSARGEPGVAHVATCRLAGGGTAKVVLGWSRDPKAPNWSGGEVTGMIAPGPRLVADPPQAGLAANARPDPSNIPNNHLSYAIQWFSFAVISLIIYAVALRKQLREE